MKNKKTQIASSFKITPYFSRHKFTIALYLLLMVVAYASNIIVTLEAAKFLAAIAELSYAFAIKLILIILGLDVFNNLMWLVLNYIYCELFSKITLRMRKDLISHTFRINSRSFSDAQTGVFIHRISSEPDHLVDALDGIVEQFTNLIRYTFIVVYTSFLNLYVGLVLLVTVIILSVIEVIRNRLRSKHARQERRVVEGISSLTNEIVRSEKDIKALGLEESLEAETDVRFKSYRKIFMKRRMTSRSIGTIRDIGLIAALTLISIIAINSLSANALTMASFMFIYTNRGSLEYVIWGVGHISERIADFKVASDRIKEIYSEEKYETEKFGDKQLENFSGKITFNKVKFGYLERKILSTDEEDSGRKAKKTKKGNEEVKPAKIKPLFKDLSFEIKPNTTVAFVGRSGSGKSTILNLIAKLYTVNGGEILFDRTNINDLSKEAVRNNVSLVNQFPYIFDDTIERNLKMAKPDASRKEIIDACKKADFWDFVKTLPNKLETKVGEGGIKLSGGQKQRLAMSRAFLRMTKIIIFDESTSSLDNFSQEEVKRSIDSLKGKSTVIVVAHRLSTIENADTIYFLDKGKIVDSGTFKHLYSTNQEFKNMYTVEKLS